MEEAIRSFIAIQLSSEVQVALNLVEEQLISKGVDGIRWVKPENIHLTILFLGDISQRRVGDIIAVMDKAAKACSPFVIKIGGLGAFPDRRKPRVVWVGVDAPIELIHLHHNIETGLVPIGCQSDGKRLKPHLTIGRIKHQASRQSLDMVSEVLNGKNYLAVCEQMVESIHLIKSKLLQSGPVYSPIAAVSLGKNKG